MEPIIKGGSKSFEILPEFVMGFLTAGKSPDLLNRVQVRRIGRQRENGNRLTDVGIIRFTFNQAFCFFMPRSIVHD